MTQENALHAMKTGTNVFLTGAPGAGKTYVLNQYIDFLKSHSIDVAVTAPTGIAASHIGGMTIHSFFGVGIREELSAQDIDSLTQKKYLWNRMRDLKVLVIDEVSMLSPKLFQSIDAILRAFKFSQEPFGGVQVILVGDFFQLPPVSSSKRSSQPTNEQAAFDFTDESTAMLNSGPARFIFQTSLWEKMELSMCYLSSSHRQEDEVLLKILHEIRSGEVSEESMEHFRSRYRKTPENFDSVTRLYTHNMDVDQINQRELTKLDTSSKEYKAFTTGEKKWVDRMFKSSLVLPTLHIKVGALVFFIKNNYEKGYINGTLGTVTSFDAFGDPVVETAEGDEITATREQWIYADSDGNQKASIKQIPLRLAWAITIHKSQGMTLDAAEIDLSKAFEPGQGYVALSRIKSLSGLKLMGLNKVGISIDPDVLKKDSDMRESSDEIHEAISNLDDDEKISHVKNSVLKLGGTASARAITPLSKLKKSKSKSPSASSNETYAESKKLFEKELSIAEIAKERDLKEMTIYNHLAKIIEMDSEFDISYLQPDSHVIESVEVAVEALTERKNEDDFDLGRKLKLKPIFLELGEKISYDEIKLALLFLE